MQRFEAAFAQGHYGGVFHGVYASAAEATAAAPASRPLGCDHDGPAAMYRDRLDRVFPSDYPMMLWLDRALRAGATRVFDLGGHVGLLRWEAGFQ